MTYIVLSDRIKELSYTQGTGNFALEGAATGFSSFGSFYSNGDNVFYAITDGTNYEVGSGVYVTGVENQLTRFPLRSSTNNAIVNFPAGTKEVYVTYPATHAVYHGSGLSTLETPQEGGMAFWVTNNIVGYDDQIIWDTGTTRLGIRTSIPNHTIDIGGYGPDSSIRASGFYVGNSGVFFPAANNGDVGYLGGRQLVHFEQNALDANADPVLGLSGVVDQFIYFKPQNKGFVFAGPPSGCGSECSTADPFFRPLTIDDIPDLDSLYASDGQLAGVSGMLIGASGALNTKINTVSGILDNDIDTVSGMLVSASGSLNNKINNLDNLLSTEVDTVSGMLIGASGALNDKIDNIDSSSSGGIVIVSGMLVSASGTLNNKIDTVSGILNADMIASGTQFLSDLAGASGALNADMIASGTQFLSDLAGVSGALNADMIASGTQFLSDLAGASGALNSDMVASGAAISGLMFDELGALKPFDRLLVDLTGTTNTAVIKNDDSDEPTHFRLTNSNGVGSRLLLTSILDSGNTWANVSLSDGAYRVYNYTYEWNINATSIIDTSGVVLDSGIAWRDLLPTNLVDVNVSASFINNGNPSGVKILSQFPASGHILQLNDGSITSSPSLPAIVKIFDVGVNGLTINNNNNVGINLDPQSITSDLDIRGDTIRIRHSGIIPSVSASGFPGEIKWDSDYIYVCVANNSWKRASLSTWP